MDGEKFGDTALCNSTRTKDHLHLIKVSHLKRRNDNSSNQIIIGKFQIQRASKKDWKVQPLKQGEMILIIIIIIIIIKLV